MSRSSKTTSGGRRLVIVESPAKAKTIKAFLGPEYVVEASVGHIRDLPERASEIPAKYKKESWARLGVDVEHGFEPLYVVSTTKKQQVKLLKTALKEADELYLATDEDREGEAIAWHLAEVLQPKVPVRRMVFHEITRDAIGRALDATRDIDQRLVDAQETRRILDRLYGYEVSPVLWRKIQQGLSAGRVQSVATRLVVERERERMAFRPAVYWDLAGLFDAGSDADQSGAPRTLPARLASVDGRRVAGGRDFGADGLLRTADVVHLDEAAARALVAALADAEVSVRSVERKPYRRSPYAPFRTTTLQQEASRKLGFSASRTMQVAQALYERGFITYMRTDSTTLSDTAVAASREQARQLYGPEFVPDSPRRYQSKVKNAQEAHEAIRPAGDTFRVPDQTGLTGDERRLYELIWKRTVASQMKDAEGQSVAVRLGAGAADGRDVEFAANGKVISFPGFMRAYVEGSDDPEAELDDRERRLPPVERGDVLTVTSMEAEGHRTKAPARYTEATLVQELEKREIGRPSTYAAILGTILARGYVWKKGTALVPSFLAFAVTALLEKHFPRLVDYEFTAHMEDDLDHIAAGSAQAGPWLTRFYFGQDGEEGLQAMVSDLGDIDAREISTVAVGEGIVVRVGRYGPYIEHDGQRATVPADLPPDELTPERARELLANRNGERTLGVDPETGREIVVRGGRYGPYVTEVLPDDAEGKPRTASLFRSMTPDTVDLDAALRLLTLPRTLGTAEDGEPVTAQNGRYGPYVKKGGESRSLEKEEQLFTVTLQEALELLAQPRPRGRSRTTTPPLRELGTDPATGRPVVVKSGRFGPYVTDGETNATLRDADELDRIDLGRAADMLAEKRAKGPAPKRRTTRKRPPSKR